MADITTHNLPASQIARPLVSILIKALNEERRIGRCIESALAEAASVQAEVIVVDSLSTDRTVAIAQQYPVRVVQFERREHIGCGAAVQLGYQHARGEFVYVLDADMELQPGFLVEALTRLQAEPSLAGVGGKLVDVQVLTSYDERRQLAANRIVADADVPELGGGGLYRRSAVEQTGYLGHRWLAAFEEAELGARLRSGGWRLLRLARPAVNHEGHSESNGAMLRRLWRNGRAKAYGAVLRSAWGRPWLGLLAHKQRHLLAMPVAHGLAFAAAVAWPGGAFARGLAWLVVWLVVLAVQAWRKRSLRRALWSLLEGHFFTLAALLGLLSPIRSPRDPIPGRELSAP